MENSTTQNTVYSGHQQSSPIRTTPTSPVCISRRPPMSPVCILHVHFCDKNFQFDIVVEIECILYNIHVFSKTHIPQAEAFQLEF